MPEPPWGALPHLKPIVAGKICIGTNLVHNYFINNNKWFYEIKIYFRKIKTYGTYLDIQSRQIHKHNKQKPKEE